MSIESLNKFSADLRRLPTVVAQRVATAAAPVLTSLVQQTFNAGQNAYGTTWAPSKDGTAVTLRKSGGLARGLVYVGIGTRLRLRLATSYAKYQVGRRPVAPTQGGALPVEYVRALQRTAVDVCREEMGR